MYEHIIELINKTKHRENSWAHFINGYWVINVIMLGYYAFKHNVEQIHIGLFILLISTIAVLIVNAINTNHYAVRRMLKRKLTVSELSDVESKYETVHDQRIELAKQKRKLKAKVDALKTLKDGHSNLRTEYEEGQVKLKAIKSRYAETDVEYSQLRLIHKYTTKPHKFAIIIGNTFQFNLNKKKASL